MVGQEWMGRTDVLEVEAKFRIPDEKVFRHLLNATALTGYPFAELRVVEFHDRYHDTNDRAILSAGYAYRIRQQGERYTATLKGLGRAADGIHRRLELQVPLAKPSPPRMWPPGKARDLALQLCDSKRLLPLLEIRQVRHSRMVLAQNCAIAEFSLDRVSVCQGNDSVAAYVELEIELLPQGSEEDLDSLVSGIKDVWGLEPENRSKFERAWASLHPGGTLETLVGKDADRRSSLPVPLAAESSLAATELPEMPGVGPDDPMSEAGRKTLRFHYQRMIDNEPGTRLGEDIEFLHDMRVATRRMRAAFRVFGSFYRPKAMAPHLKGLRRTGRALGRVRDLDVIIDKMLRHQASVPVAEQADLDGLLVTLNAERDAARVRMIEYLDSTKYARFKERFGRFVETRGMGAKAIAQDEVPPHPYRVRHVAPVIIYERLAVMRAFDDVLSEANPPLTRYHRLRIACKRLRYTLEFFLEVLGPDTKATIKLVVAMQDHLGALQDAVVASDLMLGFLEQGTRGNGDGVPGDDLEAQGAVRGIEAYLSVKQAEIEHLLDTFPAAWQVLKGSEFSRMVAETVMAL